MAIRLTLKKTDRVLFCGSKWWGDPDMPHDMQYPMVTGGVMIIFTLICFYFRQLERLIGR